MVKARDVEGQDKECCLCLVVFLIDMVGIRTPTLPEVFFFF